MLLIIHCSLIQNITNSNFPHQKNQSLFINRQTAKGFNNLCISSLNLQIIALAVFTVEPVDHACTLAGQSLLASCIYTCLKKITRVAQQGQNKFLIRYSIDNFSQLATYNFEALYKTTRFFQDFKIEGVPHLKLSVVNALGRVEGVGRYSVATLALTLTWR